MKTKFIILIALFTSVFVGCKDEKSVDELKVKEANVETDGFKINFKAVINEDDEFHLFYTEDGSDAFNGENLLKVQKKSSNEPQDITFVFPEDAAPMNIRLDLGNNEKQGNVKINEMTIEYKGKKFQAEGMNVFKYFFPNNFVEFDTINSQAKIKIIPGTHYDPIMVANEEMKLEIQKLYKK
ncbi:MAG: hypothetical protein ACH34V_02140 [Flavobacterium sp.]|mgnify:CR=1 FL=1|uniref:hypothetical protein n=1 Tax=Flavobacterium sp. TaxID=239 RepID=UPI0037B85C63